MIEKMLTGHNGVFIDTETMKPVYQEIVQPFFCFREICWIMIADLAVMMGEMFLYILARFFGIFIQYRKFKNRRHFILWEPCPVVRVKTPLTADRLFIIFQQDLSFFSLRDIKICLEICFLSSKIIVQFFLTVYK